MNKKRILFAILAVLASLAAGLDAPARAEGTCMIGQCITACIRACMPDAADAYCLGPQCVCNCL